MVYVIGYSIGNELTKLKQEHALAQQEILALKQELETVKIVTLVVRSTKRGFFSDLTHTIDNLGDNQVIVYDRVLINVGNGYNPNLGHFTVPIKGNYYISVNSMSTPNEGLYLNLLKNGNMMEQIYTGGYKSSDYLSSNEIIILPLEVGDMVWVSRGGGSRVSPSKENPKL
ncbi:hypothetical protein KUTeg_005765 [Tegillarca granosa]|uniref:C1q domain-containing protein n=1 Tax=Tegillarca granosa TaxID=220873 RepID=A0ABQ9FH96_TEGGR|nr:hypothetical protein KUTeg_005765 [Tegillarca granosa]